MLKFFINVIRASQNGTFFLLVQSRILKQYYKTLFFFQARIKNTKIVVDPYKAPSLFFQKTRSEGSGTIRIGSGVTFGQVQMRAGEIYIEARESKSEISIGDNCAVMNGCELVSRTKISIGNKVLIGPRVRIYDADFHDSHPNKRHEPGKSLPVTIEDNVWIGAGATILKGVTIGFGSIVSAGAVVTKSVPSLSIVAGNPGINREMSRAISEA